MCPGLVHHTVPNGHRSTSQCWINVEPQPSSTLIFGWEMGWKWNNDQPKINFSTTVQPKINQVWSSNINAEKWLRFGWQLVDFRLRSWFLIDHCYKLNDFSTKYQCCVEIAHRVWWLFHLLEETWYMRNFLLPNSNLFYTLCTGICIQRQCGARWSQTKPYSAVWACWAAIWRQGKLLLLAHVCPSN